MKFDPLIASLRYKGVLSFVKAFLVYLSLWRGPQACYRILAQLAEFGHSEMVLNLFSLDFWPVDSQCLDGGVVDHYTGNLWDCKASSVCTICVYFQTFFTWVLCDCLLHFMILLRSQWGDLCLHIGLFMSWPLLAMPVLGVSILLVFSPCTEWLSKPVCPAWWRLIDKVSGLEKTLEIIQVNPFLEEQSFWRFYDKYELFTLPLTMESSLTLEKKKGEEESLSSHRVEVRYRKHRVTQPAKWQTRDRARFLDS